MLEQLQKHLTETILPFWMNLADEENGGYYGYVRHDLTVEKGADKGCILNSRILWTFATAARVTGNSAYLPYARRALAWMRRYEDLERGGVYWSVSAKGRPVDLTKHTYCQAFAIYGLAAYLRATGAEDPFYPVAKERALRLFRVIEGSCRDAGGYGEAFEPDFTPVGNEKLSDNPRLMEKGETAQRTMNTLLHVLEAYAELYRALGDEEVRLCAQQCLETALHKLYNEKAGRLEVFFDRDFRSLLDMQSYGHDIESSWLMWDAAEAVLDAPNRAPYRAMCLRLAETVYDRAFTDHGLKNEIVEGEENQLRVWWVQAETVLGFANAYALTGEAKYCQAVLRQWQYIQDVIVDKRFGSEWYWCCTEDGAPVTEKPIVEQWKCPYHNGRMCLRLMEKAAQGQALCTGSSAPLSAPHTQEDNRHD